MVDSRESAAQEDNMASGMARLPPILQCVSRFLCFLLSSTSRAIHVYSRTYFYPQDRSSLKRFFLIFFCVVGALMFVGGPLAEVFLVHPMVTLLLADSNIISPDKACYDHREANQTCPDDVLVEYYFWNMTNTDAWLQGVEPPEYEEIGPYAFISRETRYNLSYSDSWDTVEYTYHQWAEFDEEKSCPSCGLNDTLVSVNRAYLQYVAANEGEDIDSETSTMFQLLPSTLRVGFDTMSAYITALYGSGNVVNQTLSQWATCAPIETLQAPLGLSSPYVKDIPSPVPLTYHPEFCQYVIEWFNQVNNVGIQPNQMQTFGVDMSLEASRAYFDLAVGSSNATYQDPHATQFLLAFLSNSQAEVLQYLTLISSPKLQTMSSIDPVTWALLKGYTANIMVQGGRQLFDSFLQLGRGGLVIERNLHEWLYGYEDPVLLLVAQASGAGYQQRPWEYIPSLSLTYSSATYPVDYLGNVSGTPMTYDMLSWNQSDIGRYLPLIQQKKLETGKSSYPQRVQEYRGLAFRPEAWGIINMTGQNEGVAFGDGVWKTSPFLTFDSALSRPILTNYSGKDVTVKGVDSLYFTMADGSIAPCNWTAYNEWADETGFDPLAYQTILGTVSPEQYNILIQNDTMLSQYLEHSILDQNFSVAFGAHDIARDRCMVPDQHTATWDVSPTFACPAFYSLPRFWRASDFTTYTTGNTSAWNATEEEHSYGLAVEPLTGISVGGHKTYQLNYRVSRTSVMYADLWVANGSSVNTGYTSDFVSIPIFWIKMTWEPKTADAYLLRAMKTMTSYLYTILVIIWPAMGFTTAISTLLLLLFGKDAKIRAQEIRQYRASRAKPLIFRSSSKRMSDTVAIHVSATSQPSRVLDAVRGAIDIEDMSDEEDFISGAHIVDSK